MPERSIEDRLREQYFDLLPKMTRVSQALTTEIEYSLRLIRKELAQRENLVVKTRIKDCPSAIDKLRQQNPGAVFDREQPDAYSLLKLRDLVGVRVLVFPSNRADQVDRLLRKEFEAWQPDPVMNGGERLAYKYNGLRLHDDISIPCEYQIVSTLIGLFWEVEHAAIYKLAPNIKASVDFRMRDQTRDVYRSLKQFEEEFERQITEWVATDSRAEKSF